MSADSVPVNVGEDGYVCGHAWLALFPEYAGRVVWPAHGPCYVEPSASQDVGAE